MRVVHLLRKLDPAEWGGTETAIERLLEGLRSQGVDSVVYCPRLPSGDSSLKGASRVERFCAFVPVFGLSEERKRQFVSVAGNLMSFDLVGSLWRERDLSLIHTHTAGRLGAIGRTIARHRGLPFVITIHGGVLDLPPSVAKSFSRPNHSGWEWGRVFGWMFQSHHIFRDADAIITCNPREAALWRERFPAKRVVVQPHGVPLEAFRQDHRAAARAAFPGIFCGAGVPSANGSPAMSNGIQTSRITHHASPRAGFPKTGHRPLLLCAGRIDPVKNQGWLLDQTPAIFQRHPEARLVFAGPCTDAAYGELIRQKIRTLGLDARVVLTGGLPPNDPRLIGLFQEAAAVVLPSVSETFGLVILEAWGAGAVVLSSRTSGPSALIQHGENGWLFDLGQPQTFHEALDRTFAQPELSREMVARGAALAAEHSLEATAARMKQLYSELVQLTHHVSRITHHTSPRHLTPDTRHLTPDT